MLQLLCGFLMNDEIRFHKVSKASCVHVGIYYIVSRFIKLYHNLRDAFSRNISLPAVDDLYLNEPRIKLSYEGQASEFSEVKQV
jgi:hypothetical protein